MSKIFIASRTVVDNSVTGDRQHLYLVYDADGDSSTTYDQSVIRGGPNPNLFGWGEITLEAGFDLALSDDDFDVGETAADRNYTELDLGALSASDVWSDMIAAAQALGTYDSGDDRYHTGIDYSPIGANSNSVINTILYRAGIDVASATPLLGGSGDPMPLSMFTAANTYLGTAGADTWDLSLNYRKIIYDQGGDDTYTVDMSAFTAGRGLLTIIEAPELGGDNELVLEGIDPGDVQILRSPDGEGLYVVADGRIMAWVPGQYEVSGQPQLTNIRIVPDIGSPLDVPVGSPSGIPFFTPDALPSWTPGVTTPWGGAEGTVSPLVLDIDASGTIELAALNGAGSVYWDIDNDGFREASGWITGGDGLLCADANSDGVIVHTELFGNSTSYANGYLALDAGYDSNNDNFITSADTNFGNLRVWVDANADGFSQSGELQTLASLGITSISTTYGNVNYTIAGNQIKQQSTFTMNGVSRTSVDAWFSYDNINTEYAGSYDLDIRTLFLPTLRGFGKLPDLHIAASENETLLDMVTEIASEDAAGMFADSFELREKMDALLYEWAGVSSVDPTSRGGTYFDARRLSFLEVFLDDLYYGSGTAPTGGIHQAVLLNQAWNTVVNSMMTSLFVQKIDVEDVVSGVTFDTFSQTFSGTPTINFLGIEGLADLLCDGQGDPSKIQVWNAIFSIIDQTVGLATLSSGDKATLMGIVGDTTGLDYLTFDLLKPGGNITWATSAMTYISPPSGGGLLIDSDGASTIVGSNANDTYYFAPGFVGASGQYATLSESTSGGTDTLRISGIDPEDLRIWTDSSYAYFAAAGSTTDILRVSHQAIYAGAGQDTNQRIERIVFDDGTIWDLTQGIPMTDTDDAHSLFGTAQNDTIDGRGGADYLYGRNGNDTLYGGNGNDYLYGNAGSDHYYGGAGADELTGDAGDDTYYFAAGFVGTSGQYDTLTEGTSAGTDTLRFIGVDPEDLRIWSDSNYAYFGIAGNSLDWLRLSHQAISGGVGQDTNQRIERIVFDDSTVWDLTTGMLMTDTDDAHTLFGTAQADILDGRGGADTLYGRNGNDTLYGGNGNDGLYGGAGNDHYYGGAGADTLGGDAGDDTYYFAAGFVGTSGQYDDLTEGTSGGTDTLRFTGIDPEDLRIWSDANYAYFGIAGNSLDVLRLAHQSISGGVGQDTNQRIERIVFDDSTVWDLTAGMLMTDTDDAHTLFGTQQNDVLDGRGGADTLYGRNGDDTLYGGAGIDDLYGNVGADTFMFETSSAFSAIDNVRDFSTAQSDKVDISDILAGYDPLTHLLTDWVEITTSGSNSILKVDRDGAGSTYSLTQIATIHSVTGLTDEAALVTSGNLIVT